jgi:hypothetical protein
MSRGYLLTALQHSHGYVIEVSGISSTQMRTVTILKNNKVVKRYTIPHIEMRRVPGPL